VQALLNKIPSLPCGAPIVRFAGRENGRVLDTADARGGNQQELRNAPDVLEDGESLVDADSDIDFGTWRRVAIGLLVRDALAVNDLPQHGRVLGSGAG